MYKELWEVRNVKTSGKYGFIPMLAHSGMSTFVTKGKEPWTITKDSTDSEATQPASKFKPINYPKADGVLTFDILNSVQRT